MLRADWLPRISTFSANLKRDLRDAKNIDDKLNVWNDSNVSLLTIDPHYVTRAKNNYAHFPLSALSVSVRETPDAYLTRSTQNDSPINAVQVYTNFHLAALRYAELGMAREAVLSEAFSLHFLEDLYSAGHYAGTWGSTALRKGTHDYYCEHGLVTQTWGNVRYSGYGDAFSTDEDTRHAAQAVKDSLEQFLAAFSKGGSHEASPDVFVQDICGPVTISGAKPLSELDHATIRPILSEIPVPSEGETGISIPRFRNETGPFVSASSGVRFGGSTGGPAQEGDTVNTVRSLELLGRAGLGTNGVLSEQSDGAIFLEFGLVVDGSQFTNPQITSRSGQRFGLRAPFWIVPGDLLFLGPILYFANPVALQNIAISASNGGLLGLEKKVQTPIGTVQLMVGRQIGVNLFGYLWSQAPTVAGSNGTIIGNYRSVELDFPVIEHTPKRSFETKLAFEYKTQLGYALEIPTYQSFNSGVSGQLHDISTFYIRFALEGVKYW